MMRSSVDRPGVKPLCCGRCLANIVLFIRARHMCAKTLAGTDRSDIPRYLVQSGLGLFLSRVEELWRGSSQWG